MGILRYIFGNDEYCNGYEKGDEWAETLIEVDAEVSPMQAERMGEDLYPANPTAFYDGFRETWNAQPELQESSFLHRLIFGR